MHWTEIPGWFSWREAQEEAVAHFAHGSRFVEVGLYLGRSIGSLAEVVAGSGKGYELFGVDTCLGSGPEGPRGRDYHADAVQAGGGTLAGTLHANLIACGCAADVTLVIAESQKAARLFAERTLDWVHLDARHDEAGVTADIDAWLPRIRPGGWISGDDYNPEKWPSVVAGVRARIPEAEAWTAGQWRWIVR